MHPLFTASLALATTVCASLAPAPIAYQTHFKREDVDPAELYPQYNISVPVDHFHSDSLYEPHSDGYFNLSYYFDATYYKPGGPVIVLQGGETAVAGRLPYLQKGIVQKLANATGGIGVILEHRYYGVSFPTEDLSTQNLRFLTTEQALADMAYFAQNVKFAGLEDKDLTSTGGTKYIAYGGSYAGAFVALLRVRYPDVYWGAISSSGVTQAIWDYWAYYVPAVQYAPQTCIEYARKITNVADNLLAGGQTDLVQSLKATFLLGNVTDDRDFMYAVAYGFYYWQSRNWDPAIGSNVFFDFCGNITSRSLLFPELSDTLPEATNLTVAGGWGDESAALGTAILNWAGWLNDTVTSGCTEGGQSQDQCYTQLNATYYGQDDLSQYGWRSWAYQYCTEWGFLQTGSGWNETEFGLPVMSRVLDIEYFSTICVDAFNITSPPDTDRINKYGGYDISYDRLAIIDGQQDPWREATPHADPWFGAKSRTSTTQQPFIEIEGAVHHWDENGLFANETTSDLPPAPIVEAQSAEIEFVMAWWSE